METEKKYSSEGRVLRPRRKGPSSTDAGRDGEHRNYESVSYGERRNYRQNTQDGGYRPRHEGGYRPRPEGEYRSRPEGGYRPRQEGEHRSYNRPEGGYRPRREGEHRSYNRPEGGYRPRQEGEHRSYNRPEGGYRPRQEGEHRSYNRPEGGYRPRQEGGYKSYNRSEGGYPKDGERRGGYKQQRGGKPNRRYEPQFSSRDEEGINRMLSRKAEADIKMVSGNQVPDRFQEEIRLNKFIANSGVCSRREADTYIQAGVVTVNGEVVTELGVKVNVLKDEVKFNGERLKGEEKVYIVMNKPKGFVTTASDPHADKTVMDLLKGCSSRVFPVGRLDKATTGVLMFTNDGEMAERLTHPSFDKKKIYQVLLDHALTDEDYQKVLTGVALNDGEIKADELEFTDETDHRKLGIEIHSGKNRIVRRIFESLGYEVKALDRVYFAGLTKKGLQKGEWRYLSEGEVNILRMGAFM